MGIEHNCHEAAARHFELAAQHHRLAAERAAGGDPLAAANLAHIANAHAVRGYRYAIRASVLRPPAPLDPADSVDDE